MTHQCSRDDECKLCRAIRVCVDNAPPLTDEQKIRLLAIFAPMRQQPEVSAGPRRAAVPPLPPMPHLPPARVVQKRPEPQPVLAGVYFIRAGETIKIGMSVDVHDRIRRLSTMNPLPLELLAVAEGGHREEALLHRRFGHLRLNGEWFLAEPELLEFIESLGYEREAAR